MDELRPLKQALLNEYGSFADKRIKNIDRGNSFIVDDRSTGDLGADKKLYSWFCSIFVDVQDSETIRVTLRGGIPKGKSVSNWLKKNAIENSDSGVIFDITPQTLAKLAEFSAAFLAIVKSGARYPVASYKYVCPRTSASLQRLASVLAEHWK